MLDRPLRVRVITGTRAEYGLFRPLLALLDADPGFELALLVTAAHLDPRFGLTVTEIEADGYRIAARIPIPLDDDSELGITRATSAAIAGFGQALDSDRPDFTILLGDRFETLAAAVACMFARVPIVHLHGGELTLGAVDDVIRHAITKMSYLHFTSTEEYRRRVIQLGEDPSRVWAVGAMGVDNALNLPRSTRAELEADLGQVFGIRTAVVTYHPVTLECATAENNMRELLSALDRFEDLNVVFTLPNADPGNAAIFEATEAYVLAHPKRAWAFASLGAQRYLSLAQEADVVVGNSSSGVIEAPSLGTPSVDIGDRQYGRVRGPSVLHASPDADSIASAIRRALSPELQRVAALRENPNGDGHAADRIAAILREQAPRLGEVKKSFRDIPLSVAENPAAADPADEGDA